MNQILKQFIKGFIFVVLPVIMISAIITWAVVHHPFATRIGIAVLVISIFSLGFGINLSQRNCRSK